MDFSQTPSSGAPRNLLSQAATFSSGHTIALPDTWLTPLRVSFIGVGVLEGIWSSRTFTVADLVGSATGTAEVGTVSAVEFSGSGILDVETSDGYREFPIFLGLSTLAADGAVATLASLAGDGLGASATDVGAAAACIGTGEGASVLAAVANAAIVGDSALSGLAGVALMAGLSGAGDGSAAIETPPSGMSFSHTFSGSTKPGGFTEFGTGYTVSGGVAKANVAAANTYNGAAYATVAVTADHFAEVRHENFSAGGSGGPMAFVRGNSSGTAFICGVIYKFSTTSYWEIKGIYSGSAIGVSANGTFTTPGDTVVCRIAVVGSTCTIYADGVPLGSATITPELDPYFPGRNTGFVYRSLSASVPPANGFTAFAAGDL
ncbi:hypothetical protein [Tsukamurella tyrosinosolvens]|uniref:hypothetical protein n=1 Tax=Tsukamurella tyrosinosolvens TaxID=57704 RepID=UPI0034623031